MSNLTTWVQYGLEMETVRWAEEFAKNLAQSTSEFDQRQQRNKVTKKAMSTSQLRKFFGEIKRIQAVGFQSSVTDVLMLQPKLAYAVGRDNSQSVPSKIDEFYKQISIALNAIDLKNKERGEEQFNNFVRIFEAIVAYHKAAGGE